jgi:CheY-like chemotaxis protein
MTIRFANACGYPAIRLHLTRNGKERWGPRQSGRIDLLVTDVVMPEMSGSELRREITASFPGIEVMFMSGYSEQHASAPAADPATVFIRKPLVPDELAQRVREVLDHR